MTVLKSIVVFLEREHAPVATVTLSLVAEVQAECHACVGCPFSKDVLSVDIVVSLLFEKLQNYVQSGIMHQEVTANSSNSNVMSIQDKTEQNLGCVVDMNCDVSCCLDKYSVPGKQSGSFVAGTLCHISDVLSLIELLACNMVCARTIMFVVSGALSVAFDTTNTFYLLFFERKKAEKKKEQKVVFGFDFLFLTEAKFLNFYTEKILKSFHPLVLL